MYLGDYLDDVKREKLAKKHESMARSCFDSLRSNKAEKDYADRMRKAKWTVLSTGWPDYCLVKKGDIRFVEVKGPGDELRPTQLIVLTILDALGMKVRIVNSDGKERKLTAQEKQLAATLLSKQIKVSFRNERESYEAAIMREVFGRSLSDSADVDYQRGFANGSEYCRRSVAIQAAERTAEDRRKDYVDGYKNGIKDALEVLSSAHSKIKNCLEYTSTPSYLSEEIKLAEKKLQEEAALAKPISEQLSEFHLLELDNAARGPVEKATACKAVPSGSDSHSGLQLPI